MAVWLMAEPSVAVAAEAKPGRIPVCPRRWDNRFVGAGETVVEATTAGLGLGRAGVGALVA